MDGKKLFEKSRDMTFYDFPWYWSDDECIRDNMKTLISELGANITILRNGRQYFFRMFDSDLLPRELNKKFGFFGKVIREGRQFEKSDDEQFYDTRDALTDLKENLNKQVFSDRIKEINGNEPTGKVLKETKNW
ncbi:hypothetical protein RhiirA5_422319 [Rhizophagus irregularis]|uniref:Uncharacterized protein n=1 Tax=Rhizophagus irregularis TaxID=588596 RepID=A0A2N0PC54_9GLOM|nr:hypothetical protein RhiirA5_422319 [Rhizophagus irregularis]GBC31944.2 hypothetical protein GLOIN_2v1549202 [Rhizophagus irregularis DAOM 181602=DAOM 197198]